MMLQTFSKDKTERDMTKVVEGCLEQYSSVVLYHTPAILYNCAVIPENNGIRPQRGKTVEGILYMIPITMSNKVDSFDRLVKIKTDLDPRLTKIKEALDRMNEPNRLIGIPLGYQPGRVLTNLQSNGNADVYFAAFDLVDILNQGLSYQLPKRPKIEDGLIFVRPFPEKGLDHVNVKV